MYYICIHLPIINQPLTFVNRQVPEYKEKITKELSGLGQDYASYLDGSPNLDAITREILRVTLMGFATRKTVSPVTLGKYTIPTGSIVILFHSTTSMDERHFPNPATINPDRLLDENGQSKHAELAREGKLLVFGAGRHACPGERLATCIIKVS